MEINDIVRRCKQNDSGAFKMIYEEFKHPLLRTALRMLKSQPDAEDAVQTTFVKLYRGVQQFNFGSQFSTYLFRILINTCYDALKKKKKTKTVPISDWDNPLHSEYELSVSLDLAIAKLPDKMRMCFTLWAIEGFKQQEIANILDLSLGGVKANIYHAKCRLRGILSAKTERTYQ